ncbi:ligase [Psychrobacter sp.]|uniref:biotin--[acetyl-CoA-carboxylase] ligase n=1 Tax=Psychrobacter sp. TaxID=56811 RepID=UPI0025E5EC1A|nr:ligase [Psychrobacter sp.]
MTSSYSQLSSHSSSHASSHLSSKPIAHHHLAVCSSTNSELMQSLIEDKIDKTQPYLLTASMQTAGRGQRTRTWQSPIGNVYLSLYHPLQVPISGLLSLVIGFHLTRLPIMQQINRQRQTVNLPMIGVKWANDIGYYEVSESETPNSTTHQRFNKLAGILIEPVFIDDKLTGVVVGVGMNIEAAPILGKHPKQSMDYQAVSLTQIIDETHKAYAISGNAKNLDATQQVRQTASVSHPSLPCPKADDLYYPISATIVRAINQFIGFRQQDYSLPKFINEYRSLNVLHGHKVEFTQHSFKQSDESGRQTIETHILQGEVMDLNEDGSLKLKLTDSKLTMNIYTGTIRLL